jgi:hypothetical protein
VHDATLAAQVRVGRQPQTLDVAWVGGLEVDPPLTALAPGQSSAGLRVLDFRPTASGWTLLLEGTAARRYDLRLVGERPARVEGAEISGQDGEVTTLTVTLPAGPSRQTRTITLSR